MAKKLKNSDVQSPYEANDGVLPISQVITEPHVSAEVHEQLCHLRNGDPVTVRDTLLAAFDKSDGDGFNLLVPACIIIRDAAMCERLVRVVVEMGRYSVFATDALLAFEQIAKCTPSDEVRRLAESAVDEFLEGVYFDILRDYSPAKRERTRRMIKMATTGMPKSARESRAWIAPISEDRSSVSRRKKKATKSKSRSEPDVTQGMEQGV